MSRYRARHRRHRSNRSFVLSALLAIVLIITTLPGTAQAAPQLTSETIQGTVTGLDASGATVDVPDVTVYAQLTSGGDYYSAQSADDGSYAISVPSAGDYDVETVCSSGTPCGDTWADAYYDDQNSYGDQNPLTVTAGTPATADFHLQRYATITGTVTDPAGNPISGITVESSPWGGGSTVTVTTGSDGTYDLTDVIPGRSTLYFRDDSGQYRFANAAWNGTTTVPYPTQPVIIAPGPTVTTANVTLQPWSGLVVTAQTSAGTPLPNIGYNVQTYNPRTGNWDGPQKGPLLTDSNGQFAWAAKLGQKVRFCVSDNFYDPSWKPKYRYTGTCWQNQSSIENATPVTFTKAKPKVAITLTLAKAGLSMRPVVPFVTGTAAVGQTLTVDTGSWTPAVAALSYQWTYYDPTQSDFAPIAGATASTFSPTSDLAGKQLTVIVTGTASGYAPAMLYGYGGKVGARTPTMSPALQIKGTVAVGSTVRAVPGTITPSGASVYFQWLVGGVPVGSQQYATGKLKLTSAMQGKVVSVRLSAYAPNYPNQLQAVAQAGPVS